jgi:hypothetical protein
MTVMSMTGRKRFADNIEPGKRSVHRLSDRGGFVLSGVPYGRRIGTIAAVSITAARTPCGRLGQFFLCDAKAKIQSSLATANLKVLFYAVRSFLANDTGRFDQPNFLQARDEHDHFAL